MCTIEPLQYLPFINQRRDKRMVPLKPTTRVECSICPNTFEIKDGKAFEATCNGERLIALFCAEGCYLSAMPTERCGRA